MRGRQHLCQGLLSFLSAPRTAAQSHSTSGGCGRPVSLFAGAHGQAGCWLGSGRPCRILGPWCWSSQWGDTWACEEKSWGEKAGPGARPSPSLRGDLGARGQGICARTVCRTPPPACSSSSGLLPQEPPSVPETRPAVGLPQAAREEACLAFPCPGSVAQQSQAFCRCMMARMLAGPCRCPFPSQRPAGGRRDRAGGLLLGDEPRKGAAAHPGGEHMRCLDAGHWAPRSEPSDAGAGAGCQEETRAQGRMALLLPV